MIGAIAASGELTWFALRVICALPGALLRPQALAIQCARVGIESLPLVLAAGASIGVVSWLQARTLLSNYGSEAQLPAIVAVFVVIGLGPVLTALVVAGQVGARLGAELGSMEITEQVDALEAMGLSSLQHLASVRVMACILMVPLLTIALDYMAIAASGASELVGGSLSLAAYANHSLAFLRLERALFATASSLVFGFLIGLISCWSGLQAEHGTEGVGKASTASVVFSMLAVLTANVIWVRAMELIFAR